MIQNTVVLKDWSFVALDPKIKPKHLGFRATGTLVNNHPRVAESKGRFWESTEIRGVHSNCVVQSANKNLFYRLEGPAAPKRHHSLSGLADIMQPFCKSIWPSNAESLLAQVSKFFLSPVRLGLPTVPGPTSGLRSSSRTPVSAATAGSGGMWCMMVYGGVCRCAVLYGGVWWCI